MSLEKRLELVKDWKKSIENISNVEFDSLCFLIEQNNPWFTKLNIKHAWNGILSLLSNENLNLFSVKYSGINLLNKRIGLILAGNIPAVGFHDVLIAILAGAKAEVKLSSEDKILLPFLLNKLFEISPVSKNTIRFTEKLSLSDLDAIIATGSDNSARYFEQYFAKLPNIIRKSRTSIAILDGTETTEELVNLVEDIVRYFGLGCRNVSKILLKGNAQLFPLLQEIEKRSDLGAFSKYDNNYLYYKSIYLVNREPFLDTENMLFRETSDLHSPISVLFYQHVTTEQEIDDYVSQNQGKLQCVVGKGREVAFGQAQTPTILDYADGIDVMKFLQSL
jgi:Acyl-CoA reductase (LuxC)